MSGEAVRAIVEPRLNTHINGAYPIWWDNTKFNYNAGDTYLACFLDCTYSEILSLRCHRDTYLITVMVHTPFGTGVKPNISICDGIIDVFANFVSGNLFCKTARSERIGQVQEHYVRRVLIDAQYDNHI